MNNINPTNRPYLSSIPSPAIPQVEPLPQSRNPSPIKESTFSFLKIDAEKRDSTEQMAPGGILSNPRVGP